MRLKHTFILLFALSITSAIAQTYVELNEKLVSLYQAGNYEEAAKVGIEALIACEKEHGKVHEEYLFSLQNLAIIYNNLEEAEKALAYYDLAIITYEKVLPNDLEEQALQANDAGLVANNAGNWGKSGQYFLYALNNLKKADLASSENYDIIFSNLMGVIIDVPDTEEKLSYLLENCEKIKSTAGINSEAYGLATNDYAISAMTLGKNDLAEDYFKMSLVALKESPENYLQILENLIFLYEETEAYDKLVIIQKERLKLLLNDTETPREDIALAANGLGVSLYELDQHDSAEYYYYLAIEYFNDDGQNLYITRSNLSTLLYTLKDVEALLKNDSLMIIAAEGYLEPGDIDLALALNDAGINAYTYDYFDLAIFYYKRALISLDKANENYYTIIGNLADAYIFGGRYAEGESTLEEYAKLVFSKEGDKSQVAAIAANNLALCKMEIGKNSEALRNFEIALNIEEKLLGPDSEEYMSTLTNIGRLYTNMGLYEEAEKTLVLVVKRYYENPGPESEDYLIAIVNLANLYTALARYDLAEKVYKEAYTISLKLLGDHATTAVILSSMSTLYMSSGRHNLASAFLAESMRIDKKVFGENSLQYAYDLDGLGALYVYLGSYAEAIKTIRKSLAVRAALIDRINIINVRPLLNLSLAQINNNQLADAKATCEESLAMQRQLRATNHQDYANTLSTLGFIYFKEKDYKLAIELTREALALKEKTIGSNNPSTTLTRFNLASYYIVTGNNKAAEEEFRSSNAGFKKQIDTYFPNLSEADKNKFYNTIRGQLMAFNTFAIKRKEENPDISIDIYNNQLITKSLLLTSVNKVRDGIINSGDSALIALYQEWRLLRKNITHHKENRSDSVDIEVLEVTANEYEKLLSERSSAFAKENTDKLITWEDIRNQLQSHEVAIELVRVSHFDFVKNKIAPDKVYYVALIVAADSKRPKMVVLENGVELENKYLKSYQTNIQLKREDKFSYEQFWQPIATSIAQYDALKKIYLSLDGVYNKISLSSLYNTVTDSYLFYEVNVEIVTNTKDILSVSTEVPPLINQSAVLIGYPKYELKTSFENNSDTLWRNEFENLKSDTLSRFIKNGIVTSLPGTKKEVETIAVILRENKMTTDVYLEMNASESQIKNLTNPYILHIATHGFFKSSSNEEARPEMLASKRYVENPLRGSGLLLAGAQNTINGQKAQSTGENGILTAAEAMNLNLDKTQLVVMSACETGLGEIKNGEGVYGLQRSFQVAGAKSVIMSLWTVDDTATQKMMTYFYENWLAGQTKREAFRNSQIKLRQEFAEPYYWGAFILIGE